MRSDCYGDVLRVVHGAGIMAAREVDFLMFPVLIAAVNSADVQFYNADEKFDGRS